MTSHSDSLRRAHAVHAELLHCPMVREERFDEAATSHGFDDPNDEVLVEVLLTLGWDYGERDAVYYPPKVSPKNSV